MLSNYYIAENNFLEAAKYKIKLLNKGHMEVAYDLGCIYEHLKMYTEMLKYYNIAVNNDDIGAVHRLVAHYSSDEHNDVTNMLKYLKIGVGYKDGLSTYMLGLYFDKNEKYTYAEIQNELHAKKIITKAHIMAEFIKPVNLA